MPGTQKMLVLLKDKTHNIIIETKGKWLTREYELQAASEGGEDPDQLFAYNGIWDREGTPENGLWVWEGELEDVDSDNMSLVFFGAWRPLNDEEWVNMKAGKKLWPNEAENQDVKTIRLEVLADEDKAQHFCVFFDRPGRAEVSLLANPSGKGTSIICHVYDGTKVDTEQEPLGAFDGTIGDNTSWKDPK